MFSMTAPPLKKPRRSEAGVEFGAPEWWRPWSSAPSLLAQTRATVKQRGDVAFMTWLDDRGRESGTVTFEGLWRGAEAVAWKMHDDWSAQPTDRVILCYLPGMAFMVAYWACQRLRCIAVPAYPPDPNKLSIGLKKLDLVKESCGAKLCLTERSLDQMRLALSLTHAWPKNLAWHRTDDIAPTTTGAIRRDFLVDADGDDVAFLQYTSGSTGTPKGVMLTYDNMWHNINEIYLPAQFYQLQQRGCASAKWPKDYYYLADDDDDDDQPLIVGSSWLPQFHDTGLVLCTVAPFIAGYRMINFSPLTFLRNPLLWLQALAKYRVDWTAAPDFAYELCVRRVEEPGGRDDMDSFRDLSCVKVLACGAGERCRPKQLERFRECFAESCNLRPNIFVPNYGLAEHVVSTCACGRGIILSKARSDLACCGEDFQLDIRIVDPGTCREQAIGKSGEIWLSSRSVAKGYWGKPDLSLETFHAKLVLDDENNESTQSYLRTGDEGFFELDDTTMKPMLFICGRLKDLIIVGGRNYFPEDVEVAAQEADRDRIRPGCVAAFSDSDGNDEDETITCVLEVRTKALQGEKLDEELGSLTDTVRTKVGIESGLMPKRIVVIAERTIPKTTSGKVQRRQTRAMLHACELTSVLYDTAGLHPISRAGIKKSVSQQALDWLARSFDDALKILGSSRTDGSQLTAAVGPGGDQAAVDETKAPESSATMALLLKAVGEVAAVKPTPETAFHELGLSSRQTVELLRRVERDVGCELPPTLVFSCPTIVSLAAEIDRVKAGDETLPAAVAPVKEDPESSSSERRRRRQPTFVSLAGRLPGNCDGLSDLRALVAASTHTATTVPFQRWSNEGLRDMSTMAARERAKYGSFCRLDGFEMRAYGLRPSEAASLDPQQRIFLDEAYAALSGAGYFSVDARGFRRNVKRPQETSLARGTRGKPLNGANVGVCLGMMNMDAAFSMKPTDVGPHDLTGNGYAAAGSRLSFLFDFKGPNVVVDTACSSSLVAMHQAMQFLQNDDCDTVLFGGCSLMLAPSFVHVGTAVAGMTSPTGRCHTFDSGADGYCRGDGCVVGALVLAEEDDEDLRLGSVAIRHNGQSATFTALNAISQTRLIEATKGAPGAGIVEAHGTGTSLGDPIELAALASVNRRYRAKKQAAHGAAPRIAGVKAVFGHTEPTAGAAGCLAAVGSLLDVAAQPNAALRRANPVAQLAKQPELRLVPCVDTAPTTSEKAGVSSFGYSGVIAHAVIHRRAPQRSVAFQDEPIRKKSEIREPIVVRRRERGEVAADRGLGLKRSSLLPRTHPALSTTWESSDYSSVRLPSYEGRTSSARLLEIATAFATVVSGTVLKNVRLHNAWTFSSTRGRPARCSLNDDRLRIDNDAGEALLVAELFTEVEDLPAELPADALAFGAVASSQGETATEAALEAVLAPLESDIASVDVVTVFDNDNGGRGAWVRQSKNGIDVYSQAKTRLLAFRGVTLAARPSNPAEDRVSALVWRPTTTTRPDSVLATILRAAQHRPDTEDLVLVDTRRLNLRRRTIRTRAVICGARLRAAAVLKPDVLVLKSDRINPKDADVLDPSTAVVLAESPGAALQASGLVTRRREDSSQVVVLFDDDAAALCCSEMTTTENWLVVTSSPEVAGLVAAARSKGLGRSVLLVAPHMAEAALRRVQQFDLLTPGGPCVVTFGSPETTWLIPKRSEPETSPLSDEAAAPETTLTKKRRKKKPTKEVLRSVVARILGAEALTTPFADLGVDSLQATEVAQELTGALGREVSPMALVEAKDVAELEVMLHVDAGVLDETPEMTPAPAVQRLPECVRCGAATPDQEMLSEMMMSSQESRYPWLPVAAVGDIQGAIRVEALVNAVDVVVERHEALRSTLVRADDETTLLSVRTNREKWPRLQVQKTKSRVEAKEAAQAFHDAYDNDPFGPMPHFRALLATYPDGGVLYVGSSHAIADGLSHQMLYVELVAVYNGTSLPPIDRRYCDYLAWAQDRGWTKETDAKVVANQQERYKAAVRLPNRSTWPRVGEDPDEVTSSTNLLATVKKTGALLHSDAVGIIEVDIIAALESQLKREPRAFGNASLPSVLLAAWAYVLDGGSLSSSSSSRRERVVQYSHTGRIGHPELQSTYGQIATDMNVLLPTVDGFETMGSFVAAVHGGVLDALRLANVPYSLAYRTCQTEPLPAQFNWYDRYTHLPEWSGGLRTTEISVDQATMRSRTFNLGHLYLMPLKQSDGTLLLKVFFNNHVYHRSTIQDALNAIKSFLDNIVRRGPVRRRSSIVYDKCVVSL